MSDEKSSISSGNSEIPGYHQLKTLVIELLQKAKRHPILLKNMNREIARKVEAFRPGSLISVLDDLVGSGVVMDLGDSEYFLIENLDHLKNRICAVLSSHHQRYPYEPGMGTSEIKKRLSESKTRNARRNVDPRLFELAMSRCKNDGIVLTGDYGVRLYGFTPQWKNDEKIAKLEESILHYIEECHFSRMSIDDLADHLGLEARMVNAVISRLMTQEKLMCLNINRYYTTSAIEHIKRTLTGEFSSKARLSTLETTTILGQSRSRIVPLLEYFDKIGFTRRNGDYRSLVTPDSP